MTVLFLSFLLWRNVQPLLYLLFRHAQDIGDIRHRRSLLIQLSVRFFCSLLVEYSTEG